MSKYEAHLRDVYFEKRAKGSSTEFYQNWMNHKYEHSLKVGKTCTEIRENEPELAALPANIAAHVDDAAYMHDISRGYEMRTDSNSYMDRNFKYHGIESAVYAYSAAGEKSLYALIPAAMHQFNNDKFLEMSDEDYDNSSLPKELGDSSNRFFKSLRAEYQGFDDKQKKIMKSCNNLVRDADKITNLLEVEAMLDLSHLPKEPRISDKVNHQMLNEPYVSYDNLETYADEACAYIAWIKALNYETSKEVAVKYGVMEHIRDYTIEQYKECGYSDEDLKDITGKMNKAIDKISNTKRENAGDSNNGVTHAIMQSKTNTI